jgi:glucan 1,3-beta-glucosidase
MFCTTSTCSSQETIVMIHDAFQPVSYWDNFMPPPKYDGVFLDTHIYQVFSDAVREFQVIP